MNPTSHSILDRLIEAPQFSIEAGDKSRLLGEELRVLTEAHRAGGPLYRRIVDGIRPVLVHGDASLSGLPMLPVRLFKTLKLQSVPDTEVLKVLTSSGTTSQQVSRIAIDRQTSMLQTRTLASIITSFIGPKRLPMIMIDSASVLRDPQAMSARGAGLVGLSNFGRDHLYALDSEMRLDLPALRLFLEKHGTEPILIFGFTFMVWKYLYQELESRGERLDLSQAILIHSGGWKKLNEQKVSNERFKEALGERCGIVRVHNFYGMVEQVGSVYMECEEGYFHTPNVAEIIIRDFRDWTVLPTGAPGLIQTLSALPRSYPGHSLLTEDIGTIYGVDDCRCGRKGTRFKVEGRMPQAELRGCSDTHAYGTPVPDPVEGIRQFLPVLAHSETMESACPEVLLRRQPIAPFENSTIDFLEEISRGILKLPQIREAPELVALAFWLRRANLTSIAQGFLKTVGTNELVKPWGVAFHVAPSNVDTIFMYSWALSMLAGNINIVRISQKQSSQLDMLLGVVRGLMSETPWKALSERNVVLTYPRSEEANRYLSARADVRIVWGGDETVKTLRALPAKPRTKEISFADKVSATAINAERYLEFEKAAAAIVAKSFYNDAYQFDQLACSSPHFVYFVGSDSACLTASQRFWSLLAEHLESAKHEGQISTASDKFVAACEILGLVEGVSLAPTGRRDAPTVVRVPIRSVKDCRRRVAGGFFVESFIGAISDLSTVVTPGDQTLSYAGFSRDEMRIAAETLCTNGVDRIIPVGQALDFGPVWDGYVLLCELTRRIPVL